MPIVPVSGVGAAGGLLAANNLSDVGSSTTSRTNLGLTNPEVIGSIFDVFAAAEGVSATDEMIVIQNILRLTGAGTAAVNDDYTYRDESNGYPYYNIDGQTADPASSSAISVFSSGGGLKAVVGGSSVYYRSTLTIDNYADLFDALQDLVAVNGTGNAPAVSGVPTAMTVGATPDVAIREITAATGTITQDDDGKIIRANRATAQTLTVTTPIAEGFSCVVVQRGAGVVTLADDATVTLDNRQTQFKTAGQYAAVSLMADADDFVILAGDTAA